MRKLGYKWCNLYNCFCDEAEEIAEESLYCDFDCNECEYQDDL
jgi:hypothetical protein